jgi:predicted metal-dependent hydrolase
MKPHPIIEYTLIRSSRKTLGLQIKNNELIVRAPQRMPLQEIKAFITLKHHWIHKHLHANILQTLTFNEGDEFLYLGKKYPLCITPQKLYFDGKKFIGNANKTSFLSFYKQEFTKILEKQLPELATQYNFSYNQVRIKAQKTRWGSCSGKNNLNFNYMLAMAPLITIDSVIIHELCHTIHKNHSQNFWKLVYQIMPNYKHYQQFLKENNHYMSLFIQ